MRFTSLIIELIRARPALICLVAVVAQAGLWFVMAMLFYWSPPGDLARLLAYGREYQVGTAYGPPLAFWLADIAYRAAGGHIVGVYALAQGCVLATFLALFALSRAIVGAQHAVIAVLLTLAVAVYGAPSADFGPAALARPLWALLLLHGWQIVGQGRRNAWFALSIEAGLLLLATPAAPWLLALLAAFALATQRSRRMLRSLDPLFALGVIAVLVLPYAIWASRAEALMLPPLPLLADLELRARGAALILGALAVALAGVVLLIVLNFGKVRGGGDDSPIVYRPPVDRLGRQFVYFFALAPPLLGSVLAGLFDLSDAVGGAGIALLLTGLAVVVLAGDILPLRRQRLLRAAWVAVVVAPAIALLAAILIMPWLGGGEVPTSLPGVDIARFFGESFERRTNRPLAAVAGDPEIAALIAMGKSRPHLLLDAAPERTPWLSTAKFGETGGVVVWRASDTVGRPPDAIASRFPGLVPEVPRAFDRLVSGRQPPLRIGWAIVRPKS